MAGTSLTCGLNTKVGRSQLFFDRRVQQDILVPVPIRCLQALHKSTSGNLSYGTSFNHLASVTIYMCDGGTQLDGTGTAYGIFIGTGLR